jgi:succinoglycan biosynthesis protein ExoO
MSRPNEPSPIVTVVIPTYNARSQVQRAIGSALRQTVGDLEILVIDDASSDGTPAVIEHAYRADPRVRLLQLEQNGGPARARNAGIKAAHGQWIALLDADDAWREDRLERLLAQATDVDAVFDNLAGYDAENEVELDSLFPSFPDGALTMEALLAPRVAESRYDFGYLKPILRRDFLIARHIAYDEGLRTSEDLLLYLLLLLEGARTRMVDEALYIYTMPINTAGGTSSHTRPRDNDVQQALENVLARYRNRIEQHSVMLIERRIAFLRRIAPISEFYYARRKRNYGRMAFLFARHVSVQREAIGKALRLLPK